MSFVDIWRDESWASAVCLQTRQRAGGFSFRIPAAAGDFSVFQKNFRPALGLTQAPIQWIQGSVLGLKRPGRDVARSHSGSAEVKERTYTSAPLACLHGADRDKFTSPFTKTDQMNFIRLQLLLISLLNFRLFFQCLISRCKHLLAVKCKELRTEANETLI
jgi:hypothetical protein